MCYVFFCAIITFNLSDTTDQICSGIIRSLRVRDAAVQMYKVAFTEFSDAFGVYSGLDLTRQCIQLWDFYDITKRKKYLKTFTLAMMQLH